MNRTRWSLGPLAKTFAVVALLGGSTALSYAQTVSSLAVTSTSLETFGTDKTVPDGGTAANFAAVTPSSGSIVGKFRLTDTSNSQAFADLAVRYQGTRSVADYSSSTLSGLMVVQTVNSQTLTDTGTISFLVNQASTSLSQFTFEWYTPDGNFTTPKTVQLNMTTFDIDFNQQVRVDEANFQTLRLSTTTRLSRTSQITGGSSTWTSVYDGGNTNSVFNEPRNAVQFLTKSGTSQTIEVGKTTSNGNSLFMFEFRTPSAITPNLLTEVPVPEPTTYAALLGLASGFVAIARRSKRQTV